MKVDNPEASGINFCGFFLKMVSLQQRVKIFYNVFRIFYLNIKCIITTINRKVNK